MKVIKEMRTACITFYTVLKIHLYYTVIKLMILYINLKKSALHIPSSLLAISVLTYQSSPTFELEKCLKECFSTSLYSCAPTK